MYSIQWTVYMVVHDGTYNYTADYSSFNLLELQNTNYENDFRILDSRQSHNARKCFLAKFVKISSIVCLNKMKSESCFRQMLEHPPCGFLLMWLLDNQCMKCSSH